jgi:hypothetical protein
MATIDCLCPPNAEGQARHPDGDTVTLKERLDFRSAATIQHAVSAFNLGKADGEDSSIEEVLGVLTEAYIRYGVESWTLVDAKGQPIPVTPTSVSTYLLSDITAASVVGDEADGLYSAVVLLPLVKRASNSSQPTPTPEPTSVPTGSPTKRPTPLKPSSTTTSPTDDTAMTSESPGGDSNSSQNSASAA